MNKQKKAFTLVELIVVITILAILGTIAFISLQGYSVSSRDSVRISDVSSMKTALELFHLDAGKYPLPDNYEEISYGTDVLRYQGTVGKTVLSQLSRSLNKIPTDPLTDKEYIFSVSGNKNEFQILNLLEGDLAYNTNQPHPTPLLRGEGIEGVLQTNAAETKRIPRIDGKFNGLYVKTANYIFPTPSLITSEPITLGSGLLLDAANIKSQVITGGKNIPGVGSVTQKTGELNIVLSVYSGTINKESTDAQKINAMKAIQGAYSGSDLAGTDIFKVILDKTTDEDLISTAETIILNKTSLPEKGNTSCEDTLSGETKDFWNVNSVAAGQSCDTHKKTFTCVNTLWKDGQNIADTDTYLYESCSVAADIVAPTGGDFTMPATTGTTTIALTITCPTDAEGSNPVQMYISGSGLSSGGNVWEDCSGTKNISITTGYGLKAISMKWKDSSGNETNEINNSINFLEAPTCYNSTVHASPAPTYSINELLGTLPINTWLCIRYGTGSIAFKLSTALPSTGIDADYSSYFNQSTLRFTTDGINWIVPTFRGFWYDESGGDDYMFLSSTEVTNGSCRSNNTCTGIRWGYQANCNSTGETAGIRYNGVLYCGSGVTGGWGYGVRY